MKTEREVLVTGATGFIGSHLTRKLVSMGADVHIFARGNSNLWRIVDIMSKINIHTIDLNDYGKVSKKVLTIRPDIVYHLAAYGVDYNKQAPQLLFKTNVNATILLLEAVSKCKLSKFVVAGSCFEYGDVAGPIYEDTPLNPVNLYGVSKAAEVMVTKIMAEKFGIPYIVCRPFGIYGPYESLNRVIPYLFLSIIAKKPVRLTGGKQIRDYIYVEDVAEAFIKAGFSKVAGHIVNICSGEPVTLKKLVHSAIEVTGIKPDTEWGAIPYRQDEMWSLIGDNTSAKRILRWEPRTPLEVGLKRTYEWFRENRNLYIK